MTNYKQAKEALKRIAKEAKQNCNDKPQIRMIINDYVHYFTQDYKLTTYQSGLLSNYACELHP